MDLPDTASLLRIKCKPDDNLLYIPKTVVTVTEVLL